MASKLCFAIASSRFVTTQVRRPSTGLSLSGSYRLAGSNDHSIKMIGREVAIRRRLIIISPKATSDQPGKVEDEFTADSVDSNIMPYCSLEQKKKTIGEMEQEFLQALQVHYLLRFTVLFQYKTVKPVCRKACMDKYGEHAIHCKELPGFKYRHGWMRDVLGDILRRAGISAKKEPPVNFLTDPIEGRSTLRPADLLVFGWAGGKHACVDLTGVSPLAGLRESGFVAGQAIRKAESKKAFYYEGKAIMSNEEFDNLKEELMWEGSSVVMLSSDEQKLLEATMAYISGNPIMSDVEFDNLKKQLKKDGSDIVAEGPRCSLRSRKVYSDLTVDYLKMFLINVPAAVVAVGLFFFLDDITGFEITYLLELPEPFSFIFTWFAALPFILWLSFTLTNVIVRDFLILKGLCPNCGTENTSFFGTILSISSGGSTNTVKCTNCQTVLVFDQEDRLITLPEGSEA
ncbi:putative PGR5-like protein [Helianthus anomalus]